MAESNRHQPAAASLACALDPDEKAQRTSTWADLDQHAIDRSHDEGVLRTSYPNRPELRERLERLVEAERGCCPFLALELVEDGEVINLVLRYPPGAEGLIADALFEAGSDAW